MENSKKKNKIVMPNSLVIITLTWLAIIVAISLNILETRAGKFNEWGDFFAGFSAPVLFIWVLYGIILQRKELTTALEDFSTSVELMQNQHHVIWFNRNISRLKDYINELKVGGFDSPILINPAFTREFALANKNIFDDVKSIIELNIFIENGLIAKQDASSHVKEILIELNDEYKILYEEDINYCKNIYWKMAVLISLSNHENDYKHYENFKHWYSPSVLEEIYILIDNADGITLDQRIDLVLLNNNYDNILFEGRV